MMWWWLLAFPLCLGAAAFTVPLLYSPERILRLREQGERSDVTVEIWAVAVLFQACLMIAVLLISK